MDFQNLIRRATEVREQYAVLERARYGRAWTTEELMLGFLGDVGDLSKLVLAHGGVREIPGAGAKLAHELADCLWSILVLSQRLDVDLEDAFSETMDDLERHIQSLLQD